MTPRGSARISRRGFLAGTAGLAGLGVGAAAVGLGVERSSSDAEPARQTVDFYGRHQAGITTAPAAHANFIGLDLVDPTNTADLAGALTLWTQDGARLTAGTPGLADPEPELATAPSRLTVTVGLGPRAFSGPGLAERRPLGRVHHHPGSGPSGELLDELPMRRSYLLGVGASVQVDDVHGSCGRRR